MGKINPALRVCHAMGCNQEGKKMCHQGLFCKRHAKEMEDIRRGPVFVSLLYACSSQATQHVLRGRTCWALAQTGRPCTRWSMKTAVLGRHHSEASLTFVF